VAGGGALPTLAAAARHAWCSSLQRGNNLKGFTDFSLKKESIQGQNLVLTVWNVPTSLDSGMD